MRPIKLETHHDFEFRIIPTFNDDGIETIFYNAGVLNLSTCSLVVNDYNTSHLASRIKDYIGHTHREYLSINKVSYFYAIDKNEKVSVFWTHNNTLADLMGNKVLSNTKVHNDVNVTMYTLSIDKIKQATFKVDGGLDTNPDIPKLKPRIYDSGINITEELALRVKMEMNIEEYLYNFSILKHYDKICSVYPKFSKFLDRKDKLEMITRFT